MHVVDNGLRATHGEREITRTRTHHLAKLNGRLAHLVPNPDRDLFEKYHIRTHKTPLRAQRGAQKNKRKKKKRSVPMPVKRAHRVL
jgi:hypothetical protein